MKLFRDLLLENPDTVYYKKKTYSLVKQAEKQYGMPIAQIRQKYRNVPLDQLVKKESLYKKLLKALRG